MLNTTLSILCLWLHSSVDQMLDDGKILLIFSGTFMKNICTFPKQIIQQHFLYQASLLLLKLWNKYVLSLTIMSPHYKRHWVGETVGWNRKKNCLKKDLKFTNFKGGLKKLL